MILECFKYEDNVILTPSKMENLAMAKEVTCNQISLRIHQTKPFLWESFNITISIWKAKLCIFCGINSKCQIPHNSTPNDQTKMTFSQYQIFYIKNIKFNSWKSYFKTLKERKSKIFRKSH